MEMEKINDNTIRVLLENEDLTEVRTNLLRIQSKMMIQKIRILMILTTVPRTAMSLRMSWLITYAVS